MSSNDTKYFSSKLLKCFENNIKLSLISEYNVLIITKEDKIYEFDKNAINNSILVFSNNKSTIEQKINESLKEDLCYKGIIDIKEAFNTSIARTSAGKICCWGSNECGNLGNNSQNDWKVYNKFEMNEYLSEKEIIEISCGVSHTLVLTIDGEVYSWGSNGFGQIGNKNIGKDRCQLMPYFINEFNGQKVKSISCGTYHSLALTNSGLVYSWGYNYYGQLGRNSNSFTKNFFNLFKPYEELQSNHPKPIELEKHILIDKISCGRYHSLILSRARDIYIFGDNLEMSDIKSKRQFKPIKLNIDQKFTDIASHYFYKLCASHSINGLYYIWGKVGKVGDEEFIKVPKLSHFNSFNDIFVNYFQRTYNTIEGNIFEFNDNFIRNGFYEKDFIEIEVLGKGYYGEVFKVKKIKFREEMAIKRIEIKITNDISELSKELENFSLIKNINYEYIVTYYDLWFETLNSKLYVFIQMELCDKSLDNIIKAIQSDNKLVNNNCLNLLGYYISCQLFIQILEGVNYLHSIEPQIIHRDLKPDNILIKINEDNNVVKIADLGLICLHQYKNKENESNAVIKQYHTQDIGPISYAAPEVLDSTVYDTKSDIYSLGIILRELFLIDNLSSINMCSINESSLESNYYELKNLCQTMTDEENPDQRPDCQQVLQNSYLWALSENKFENLIKQFTEFCDECDKEYRNSYIFKLINKLLTSTTPFIHHNVGFDECSITPIICIRCKCNECENFNLCESCYEKSRFHSESHTFTRSGYKIIDVKNEISKSSALSSYSLNSNSNQPFLNLFKCLLCINSKK